MAEKGLWQGIRSFVAEQVSGSRSWSEPARTPEGEALGFEWEATKTGRGAAREDSALLWPSAAEAMETGPLAAVDHPHPAAGWMINNGEDQGFDREEAMEIAEDNAAARYIEPLAEASESYYARLSALAESKGAAMDRDVTGNGFDVER